MVQGEGFDVLDVRSEKTVAGAHRSLYHGKISRGALLLPLLVGESPAHAHVVSVRGGEARRSTRHAADVQYTAYERVAERKYGWSVKRCRGRKTFEFAP